MSYHQHLQTLWRLGHGLDQTVTAAYTEALAWFGSASSEHSWDLLLYYLVLVQDSRRGAGRGGGEKGGEMNKTRWTKKWISLHFSAFCLYKGAKQPLSLLVEDSHNAVMSLISHSILGNDYDYPFFNIVNTILLQLAILSLAAIKGVTTFIGSEEPDPELAPK